MTSDRSPRTAGTRQHRLAGRHSCSAGPVHHSRRHHVRQVKVDSNGDVVAMILSGMSSLHLDYVIFKYRPSDGFIIGQSKWGVSGDMILFRLDSVTGIEVDRSTVGGGPAELAAGDFLRLDAAQNIYVGGGFSDFNTGAAGMAVLKYASLVMNGDANGDGSIDILDLLSVLAAWGHCTGCPQDFLDDGQVGINDLLILLANRG